MGLNVFSISSLVASVLITLLGIVVYQRSSRNNLAILFLILTIAVGFLNFFQFQMRTSSSSLEALLWAKVYGLWPITITLSIHMILELGKRKTWPIYYYVLLYLPAGVIAYIHFATDLFILDPVQKFWGWTLSFNSGFFYNLSLFMGIASWIVALLLLLFYIRRFSGATRNLAVLVFIGFAANFVFALASDAIMPYLHLNVPELGSFGDLITFGIIGYGIWRYDFFSLGINTLSDRLFSSISNYLILLDSKRRILEVNEFFLERLGYSRKELLGRSIDSILSSTTQSKNPILDFSEKHQEFSAREIVFHSKKGEEVLMAFSASLVRLSNRAAPGIMYVGADNDLKLTSLQSNQKHSRHIQFLAESTLDLVALDDKEEVYAYIADSLYNLFEKNAVVVVSETLGDVSMYTYQVKIIKGINERIKELGELVGFNITRMSSSSRLDQHIGLEPGKLTRMDLNLEHLTNGKISENVGKRVLALFGITELRSITIQQGLEEYGSISILTRKSSPPINEELIHSFIQIASLVLKRFTIESELDEINSMQTKLFSVIGHDLKSPISNIIGFANIIMNNRADHSDAKLEEYVTTIKDSAITGNHILDSLLEWSRSIKSKSVLHKERFLIQTAIVEAVNQVRVDSVKKDIRIVNRAETSISIFADPNMIKTVVRNVLSNSVKFSHPGDSITIDSEIKNGFIHIVIADSGLGMKPEQLKLLFSFERVLVGKGTAGESGIGFGLKICKDFMERNNGRIEVQSQENTGSMFSLIFPVSS